LVLNTAYECKYWDGTPVGAEGPESWSANSITMEKRLEYSQDTRRMGSFLLLTGLVLCVWSWISWDSWLTTGSMERATIGIAVLAFALPLGLAQKTILDGESNTVKVEKWWFSRCTSSKEYPFREFSAVRVSESVSDPETGEWKCISLRGPAREVHLTSARPGGEKKVAEVVAALTGLSLAT
jgi:hypothetical protein